MGSGSSKSRPAADDRAVIARVAGEDVRLIAGDADPISLSVLQCIKLADEHEAQNDAMLAHIEKAVYLLKDVPVDAVDELSVLVFQREGLCHYVARRLPQAKEAFRKAIQIAEVMVSERRPRLYLVLQRYCDAVLCLTNVWRVEHEQQQSQKRAGAAPSVEHRGAAVLKSRRSCWGAIELALLRCVELIELGDHRQSELLLLPLLELGRIYETLHVYNRAVMVIRKAIGILCIRYGYDHLRVPDLNARCDRLMILRDDQLREEAAVKLQSLARMIAEMRKLSATLNRPVVRHVLMPRKLQEAIQQRHSEFLATYAAVVQSWRPTRSAADDAGCQPGHSGVVAEISHGSAAVHVGYLKGAPEDSTRGHSAGVVGPLAAVGLTAPPRPVSGRRTTDHTIAGGASTATHRVSSASQHDTNFVRNSFAIGSRPGSAISTSGVESIGIQSPATPNFAKPQSDTYAAAAVSSYTQRTSAVAATRAAAVLVADQHPASQMPSSRGRMRSWAAHDGDE